MNVSVLIIDDEEIVRELIKAYLSEDYTVLEAEDGAKGIETFKKMKPDVVIVDLNMPVIDGLEVLKEISKNSPTTPVIVISGTSAISDVVRSIQLGAWNYFTKPIMDFQKFTKAIEKALLKRNENRRKEKYQKSLEMQVIERTKKLELANEKLLENKIELEKRVENRTQELVEINKQLAQKRDEANSATIAKSAFLANMSHEIRTPMNGVIAAADLALDEELSPQVKKYINIIKSSGNNLLSIINDILDLSKIEAGKLELAPYQFKFCEMMESITDLFIATIREKEIEFVYDIDPYLPCNLYGDKTRIKQILTNLIGNSFKFTGSNGYIKLTVRYEEIDDEELLLNFSVYDNGIGISQNQQQKLFKAFSQADISTTRKFGGSGLGLALCKQLTEFMDGTISVKSIPDKETIFDFSIKLKKIDGDEAENLERFKDMKALVADSNNENSEILIKHLESIGFKTNRTTTCKETLELDLSELNNYSVIFVEWDMGKLNNINISNVLKKTLKISPAVIPVISTNKIEKLSGNDKNDYKIILQKPFHRDSLLRVINVALEDLSDLKEERAMHIQSYKSLLTDLKLLIVEDNPVNQKIAIAILKKVGIKTYVAENGIKAIDILKRRVFDMVLMDIQMPKMDGYTATKVIREELKLRDLPIIAMTAHALKGDREKCFESGMDQYISKPIDRTLLYEVLLKALHKKDSGLPERTP